MSQLALSFLGAPYLERDGVSITLSHHKATALLAYLAVTRQPHTRQALAALLWPDHDAANGRAGVRRMLWVLNKNLGQAWLEADHDTVLLPSRPGLWLDVDQFRALLANRRQHGHALSELCPACLAPLTEAVALVRGDFMAGFTLPDSPDFGSWQAFETESLRRELAGALEQLVQLLSRSDDRYEPAIGYARRRLALDPLHEPAHRQLMQLYAWAGQAAAALQQYQSCIRVLQQELGLPPSAETTALAEAIKANRLPPPPGSPAPATASAQPAATTTPTPPAAGPLHNLPAVATPFIGRKAALDNLEQRLAAPDVRLMTIVGPGGIGKTRLALALAERYIQSSQFSTLCADGIYFIPLTPLRSDQAIVQAIAEGLALPLTAAGEPATQLLTYLRHKQLLLILDNFEHLLAGAPLVGHILQTAGGVKIVVTSQERLNLTEENLWQIGGLNFAGLTGVEEALAYEAVQLFIQRARQVRPDFTLQSEDLPYLERILQGVWGMPLAIELAAAWLNMLSLAGVASELSYGLDLLESELRDVPDRHRSMRLVFDHSWQRLAEAEQTLLKKLSVFRGGFSREAAQQVAGASLRLLAGLVNKSWLISRPDSSRYELHELIRQYTAARLQAEPQEEQASRDRHSRYYLRLLQDREPDLKSSRQKETVAGLSADIDNIRSAWETAVAYEALDRLHTAAYALWYFHNLRDSLQEGEQAFNSAVERLQRRLDAIAPDQAAPDRTRLAGTLGELLSHQAQFTFRQGRIGEAAALYETSLTLLRPLDEPAALAQALTYRGVVCWLMGQFEEAWPYLTESLAMTQTLGDEWGQVQSLGFMGMIAQAQGDHDRAYHYLSDSLARSRVMGDTRLISFIGSHLAHTLQALGRVSEGLDLLRENLRLAIDTNDRLGIGVTLEQMAIVTQVSGNEAEARRLLAESIDQFRDVGDTWFLSRALTLAGYLALAVGEADQAYDLFRQAGQVAVATQAPPNILAALAGLAEWSARSEQPERALEIALHILRHPASTQDAKDRAETLRTELAAQLTPEQVEMVQDRVQAEDFEAMRQEVLG